MRWTAWWNSASTVLPGSSRQPDSTTSTCDAPSMFDSRVRVGESDRSTSESSVTNASTVVVAVSAIMRNFRSASRFASCSARARGMTVPHNDGVIGTSDSCRRGMTAPHSDGVLARRTNSRTIACASNSRRRYGIIDPAARCASISSTTFGCLSTMSANVFCSQPTPSVACEGPPLSLFDADLRD